MSITKLKIVNGEISVDNIIERLLDMRPNLDNLEDFDMSRKNDYVYCIEWGMKKQKWMEQLIYERTIEDLKNK